jgi:molybdopterin-guanine dinucleotide biosynthesis protein A
MHNHINTEKSGFGKFGRFEISILGTKCNNIRKLVENISPLLKGFRTAFIDSNHTTTEDDLPEIIRKGTNTQITDNASFLRMESSLKLNSSRYNLLLNEYDLVLVNGNHFETNAQIVVVDSSKSLENKLSRITNPVMIILAEGEKEVPKYLEKHIPDLEFLPILKISDPEQIAVFIHDLLLLSIPPLLGVVLSGGKSTQMGRDRGMIDYHGLPQRIHMYYQLSMYTAKSFLSLRKEQADDIAPEFNIITDSVDDLGPLGALISTFRKHPNHAWLSVACNLPLLSGRSLNQLVTLRNPSKIATAFRNPATEFADPSVVIWEPKAYPVLLQYLALGHSCLKKIIQEEEIEILEISDPDELFHVNSSEDFETVRKKLDSSGNQTD